MLLISIVLQLALGLFSQQPNLATGNLSNYHPLDTLVSEAPRGYKPFYISHIARHGSRFALNGDAFAVIGDLESFDNAGELTADGQALLGDLRTLQSMAEGNYGKLTALGEREHRQICDRMLRHYPEVFSNSRRRNVDTYSTESGRVMKSRDSFLEELNAAAPGLNVTRTVGKDKRSRNGEEVRGFYLSQEDANALKREVRDFSKTRDEMQGRYDFKAFAAKMFVHPDSIPQNDVADLARRSYNALKNGVVNDIQSMNLGKYFTPSELYRLWLLGDFWWAGFLNYPGYSHYMKATAGKGIIKCMVEDAEEAVSKKSHTAATLRFSHDSFLMPLMCAFPLEETVLDCDEHEIPELFQNFRIICPACNVQMVFFRNRRNKILVKILLNERETRIHGLAPDTGCFYEWTRLKDFLNK